LLNIHRRHLSDAERAKIAATIENMPHGGDRKTIKSADAPLLEPKISRKEAAEMLNSENRSHHLRQDRRYGLGLTQSTSSEARRQAGSCGV
jgi:hypothetical protein